MQIVGLQLFTRSPRKVPRTCHTLMTCHSLVDDRNSRPVSLYGHDACRKNIGKTVLIKKKKSKKKLRSVFVFFFFFICFFYRRTIRYKHECEARRSGDEKKKARNNNVSRVESV